MITDGRCLAIFRSAMIGSAARVDGRSFFDSSMENAWRTQRRGRRRRGTMDAAHAHSFWRVDRGADGARTRSYWLRLSELPEEEEAVRLQPVEAGDR